MHWIDWVIVIVPLVAIVWLAFYCRRFVRGVVDYLSAGRVAGRYVLTVGDMTAGLGLITLLALTEVSYRSGFAISFWQVATATIGVFVGLTGWVLYRFRETKAMSNGQFLELRYSRSLRVVASFLRLIAEMLANSIAPAIAANFLIYFLGLPHKIMIFGAAVPTFAILVGVSLLLAMAIILPGGRISLLVTDSIQGLLCFPVIILFIGFIMYKFSWTNDIAPVLIDRAPGESFINPLDISKLRDFNIFMVLMMVINMIYNRGAYVGNDSTTSGRTPHEQKMGAILGSWRYWLSLLLCMMIGLTIVTVMNQPRFAQQAHEIRQDLSHKVADGVFESPELHEKVSAALSQVPVQVHEPGVGAPMSQSQNLDTAYINAVKKATKDTPNGSYLLQNFRSLYYQMMMPMGMRRILPVGMLGVFFLLGMMLMVTTDDSRMFNASSAIVQDLVVPFRKKPMEPPVHLKWVKGMTWFVAVTFFCGSLFFAQLDYIQMFLTIMVSIWMGAAAPIMVFGLYSRFGNTVGAYGALIFGSGSSVAGVILQQKWADVIYPMFEKHNLVDSVGQFLSTVSQPFNPYIVWTMNPAKCPINSYEFLFISMFLGTSAYIIGSLVTYKGPYNLERMLHRGKYNLDNLENIKSKWTWKSVWGKLIGISPDYSCGDKVIAWSVFIWTIGYRIGICFVGVLIWNAISPWDALTWSKYYFVVYLVIASIVSIITAIWFTWGGIRDVRRLFHDLSLRIDNPLDDGTVKGHVSLADIPLIGSDEVDEEEK